MADKDWAQASGILDYPIEPDFDLHNVARYPHPDDDTTGRLLLLMVLCAASGFLVGFMVGWAL